MENKPKTSLVELIANGWTDTCKSVSGLHIMKKGDKRCLYDCEAEKVMGNYVEQSASNKPEDDNSEGKWKPNPSMLML